MNIQNIMSKDQKMQKEITKKKEEIYAMTFVGKSEWVDVSMNGKKMVMKIEIKYDGDINGEKEMLADMITIAINDAHKQIDKEIEQKLGVYSKQLGGLM